MIVKCIAIDNFNGQFIISQYVPEVDSRQRYGFLFSILSKKESSTIWIHKNELRDLAQHINQFLLDLENDK